MSALDTSEPEPDVAVVPLDDYDTEHPSQAYLTIEVAESSLKCDRGIKQRIYARPGVPKYWIVDTASKSLDVYRDPQGDRYASVQKIGHTGSLAPIAFKDLEVEVAHIMR